MAFKPYHRIARPAGHAGCTPAGPFPPRGRSPLGTEPPTTRSRKFQSLAVAGLELDPHIAELAVAAGLLLVTALDLHLFADGLTVGRRWGSSRVDLHAELALQLGDHHIQMLLAQAANASSGGFRYCWSIAAGVGSSSIRRIRPWAILSSSPFLAGAMAMLRVGVGILHPFQGHLPGGGAQGVARIGGWTAWGWRRYRRRR